MDETKMERKTKLSTKNESDESLYLMQFYGMKALAMVFFHGW